MYICTQRACPTDGATADQWRSEASSSAIAAKHSNVQATGKSAEEQIVTADPDVRVLDLHPEDKFLILACDGIWDMLTNDQAVRTWPPCVHLPPRLCLRLCAHAAHFVAVLASSARVVPAPLGLAYP